MGAKQSSNPRMRTYSNAGEAALASSNGNNIHTPSTSGGINSRARTRSLGSVHTSASNSGHPLSIPTSNGGTHGAGSPDSDASTPDEVPTSFSQRLLQASSLPVHLLSFHGIKCPVCSKVIPPDDIEYHLVMCLTKPRISYNEDVLTEDKGECVICLDDLQQGDTIARLPCLCIYHKGCIDSWFKKNRSCPEHPND